MMPSWNDRNIVGQLTPHKHLMWNNNKQFTKLWIDVNYHEFYKKRNSMIIVYIHVCSWLLLKMFPMNLLIYGKIGKFMDLLKMSNLVEIFCCFQTTDAKTAWLQIKNTKISILDYDIAHRLDHLCYIASLGISFMVFQALQYPNSWDFNSFSHSTSLISTEIL